MKFFFLALFVLFAVGCTPNANEKVPKTQQSATNYKTAKPKVSFTFDDGITKDIVSYKFEDWNKMILTALKEADVKATFFVTGVNKLDEKGKYLLNSWSHAGHSIANHSFTHPNFNDKNITIEDFEAELLRTDTVIVNYDSYVKLFRFPYLKEGKTSEKIAGYRNVLSKHGYKNGHVTIDASDWYVNSELIKHFREAGTDSPKVEQYKAFYLQHLLERANFYEELVFQLTDRHIHHTLLLHHNLTSALFLKDLIQAFKAAGWEIVDSDRAFQDDFYNNKPNTIPAGESLVWSLAKASGQYEGLLRYPAEDSQYEIPKMKKMGL